ncbi:MAG: T9SS type A sorting domain-containing protein [Bacteroidota bacterium]
MSWKETTPPNAPTGLTINKLTTAAVISWTAPGVASDGELASQYVLYRSHTLPIDFNDPRNIVAIQTNTSYFEQPLPSQGITYYYAVTGVDRLQNESLSSNIMGLTSSGVVGLEAEPGTISSHRLHQNFPNPFNPTTLIRFQLPQEQQVTIRVYDLLGREVRTLFNGIQRGGEHQVLFDASGLPTGVYVYRLVAGEYVESRKMQLVR